MRVVQHDAWKALRVAARHRIVGQRRRHLREPVCRLVVRKRLAALRCEGQLVLGLAVRRNRLRAIGLNAFGAPVREFPDAGDITPRRGP
jgi:hypothetical protein